jgi:hypothetical protein
LQSTVVARSVFKQSEVLLLVQEMAYSRLQWRRFTFFDKELCEDNTEQALGARVTCAVAEGGSLIFGDVLGNVYISDRSTELSDKKHKLFRGEVKGLAYIYHPQHRKRQYIIAVGDDSESNVVVNAGSRLRVDNSTVKVRSVMFFYSYYYII